MGRVLLASTALLVLLILGAWWSAAPTSVAQHLAFGLVTLGVAGFVLVTERERRRSEERRRLAEERHELAARAARDGLFDWDVAAGQTFWSARLRQLLGPLGENLDERTRLEQVLHVDEQGRWSHEIWPALARGESIIEEVRIGGDGAESRWIEVRAGGLLDDGARVIRVVGFVRDITERREADRFKEEFLSTVSHELRTPLTAIKGALSLLHGEVAPEQGPRLVEMAMRNVGHLESLVDDLLDLQKLVQDYDSFEIRILDPARVTREAGEQLARLGQERSVRLEVEIDDAADGRPRIVGDERRLIQVLSNLIANAVKFSAEGSRVRLLLAIEEGAAVWTVADRGIGIPEEVGERVFERFWQLEKGDARRYGGTGLGLAIAKSIVKLHGGEIGYRARQGGGTEFEVRVPLRDLAAPRRQRTGEAPQPLSEMGE